MSERSLYGLYNAITLGVTGTSMAPFVRLSEEDRWALAFFVSGLGMPAERLAKAEAAWRSGAGSGARAAFPDLASLPSVTETSQASVAVTTPVRYGAIVGPCPVSVHIVSIQGTASDLTVTLWVDYD